MRLFPTRRLREPVGITSLLGSGFAVRRDLDSPGGPIPLVVSGEPHSVGRVSVVSHDRLASWLLSFPRKPVTPMRFSVDVAA